MALFSKKLPEPAPGASFPFLERIGNEKMKLRYDAIRISRTGLSVTVTFLWEGVPMFAWTTRIEAEEFELQLDGVEGKIDISLTRT